MIGRLARQDRGFTLIETLIVATLMLGASGAVLGTLTEFGKTTRLSDQQNDAQQESRRALGALAGELRNLASPTNELPVAVLRAEPSDLIFLSVEDERPEGSLNERSSIRVRYCLDTATGTVWRHSQSWTTETPPAAPTTTDCSGTAPGWPSARVAATNVSNGARPLFTFNSADLVNITEIRAKLYLDADPASRPAEIVHETVVFLRNQNRGPTASFTVAATGSQILLNGSESEDPEGKALDYSWYDNGGSEPVGRGIVLTYSPSQPGNHSITLKVKDPAGLEQEAPAQTVCIVGGETPCS